MPVAYLKVASVAGVSGRSFNMVDCILWRVVTFSLQTYTLKCVATIGVLNKVATGRKGQNDQIAASWV